MNQSNDDNEVGGGEGFCDLLFNDSDVQVKAEVKVELAEDDEIPIPVLSTSPIIETVKEEQSLIPTTTPPPPPYYKKKVKAPVTIPEEELPIAISLPTELTIADMKDPLATSSTELKGRGKNRPRKIAASTNLFNTEVKHINAYTCEYCLKVFRFTGSLSKHRKRHGEPQLPCPVCQKCFYTTYEVTRHLLRAHGPKGAKLGTNKTPLPPPSNIS